MAKASDSWNVLEHGPIQELAENLWWVSGALPRMSLRRTMVVARRTDGSLVIHNGIALNDTELKKFESFGSPAYLIVPNAYHRLDAPAYKKRFPKLAVFAPRGSRDAVSKVVSVDGTYEDFPHDDAVRLETLRGVAEVEGAMLVRSSDGVSVVLNDVMFNMRKKKDPLGWFFTTVLGSAPGPRVSRLSKLALIKDQPAVRAELLRYAELPDLVRVIVAHEDVAHGPEAQSALRTAATFLRAS